MAALGGFTPRAIAAVLYLAVFGTALTYVGLHWFIPRVPLAAGGLLVLSAAALAGIEREPRPGPKREPHA